MLANNYVTGALASHICRYLSAEQLKSAICFSQYVKVGGNPYSHSRRPIRTRPWIPPFVTEATDSPSWPVENAAAEPRIPYSVARPRATPWLNHIFLLSCQKWLFFQLQVRAAMSFNIWRHYSAYSSVAGNSLKWPMQRRILHSSSITAIVSFPWLTMTAVWRLCCITRTDILQIYALSFMKILQLEIFNCFMDSS